MIEINVDKMEKVTRELTKTTHYAKLLEIQDRVQAAETEVEAEEEAQGETAQEAEKTKEDSSNRKQWEDAISSHLIKGEREWKGRQTKKQNTSN